jgi:hypothetical protein
METREDFPESELLMLSEDISKAANDHFTEFNEQGYAKEGKLQYIHGNSVTPDYLAANGIVEFNGWGLLFPDEIDEFGIWSEARARLWHLLQFHLVLYPAPNLEGHNFYLPCRTFELYNWVTGERRQVYAMNDSLKDGVNQTFGSYAECLIQAWKALDELKHLGESDIDVANERITEALEIVEVAGFVKWAATKHRIALKDSLLSTVIQKFNPDLDSTIPLDWRIALL